MGVVKKYVIKRVYTILDQRTLKHSCKYFTRRHLSTFKRRTNNSFFNCFPFICCQAISTIEHLNF